MAHLLAALKPQKRLDSAAVHEAYRLVFDRPPESDEVVELHRRSHRDVWSLLATLMQSHEFRSRASCEVRNHRMTLDAMAVLSPYQQSGLEHRRGFITNFLGIETDISFLGFIKDPVGYVGGLPIPCDFHSHVSEWVAALRGVDLSGDDFVVVELGAGWGPWMADLSRAARIKGAKRTRAIGCEGDRLHCECLIQHMANNGFATDEYKLYQGVVGLEKGTTLFPLCSDSTNVWGSRPIFCASEREADELVARGPGEHRGLPYEGLHKVRCYSLEELFAGLDHVDVLHIDIQGDEARLLAHNIELVQRLVSYVVIGTHGRQIEGELMALMGNAGWKLEVEEPCSFNINTPHFVAQVDGVQGWRNPRFAD